MYTWLTKQQTLIVDQKTVNPFLCFCLCKHCFVTNRLFSNSQPPHYFKLGCSSDLLYWLLQPGGANLGSWDVLLFMEIPVLHKVSILHSPIQTLKGTQWSVAVTGMHSGNLCLDNDTAESHSSSGAASCPTNLLGVIIICEPFGTSLIL